jgi:hypothetical protein
MKPCNHPTCNGTCRRPRKKTIRKPLKRYSKKREKENRKYATLRRKYLIEHVHCEARLPGCENMTTQVHHKAGRIGEKFLDVSTWLAVCHPCHVFIETHPAAAKQLGLSESRLTK